MNPSEAAIARAMTANPPASESLALRATAQPPSPLGLLRQQHPDVALTAELLMVQGDQFVVRAELRRADQLLATGLAADGNLERAEDRARLRALDALGLSLEPTPLAVDVHLVTPEPVVAPLPEPSPIDRSPAPAPLPEEPADLVAEIHYEPLDLEPEPELELEAPAKSRPRRRRAVEEPLQEETIAVSPDLPLIPVPEPPAESALPADHDDWSEELADIEVELKRLSWSADQQQNYLQHTYGKRSLTLLTDYADLVDFLGYLRSLPMPVIEPRLTPPAQAPLSAPIPDVVTPAGPSREQMMDQSLALVKQLAWTNRQAVDHLQRTYGKATRQDLTDGELSDFIATLTRISQETELAPF